MRSSHFRFTWLPAVLILVASAPLALAAEPETLASVEGTTEYQLDNGLRVLLFPDMSRAKVTVNVTYLVGSRHEGYGEAGMAHLLEHMLFKGTPTHPNIPKSLGDRGANFNGSTSVDRTNYYETLPASDENLEFALALEADRMVNSFVRREDLDSEMTVVRSEFERRENSPSSILRQRVTSAAYDWHNYGQATIGNRSDIERVPINKLKAFYRRFYQPDNALLVVAGRFDLQQALTRIQETFGAIPRPTRELDKTYTVEPPQDGERTVVLRRVGDVAMIVAAYHMPAGAHPDFASLRVLAKILSSDPSGRLYKALVEAEKATAVHAMAGGRHDPGLFEAVTLVRQEDSLNEARDVFLEVLEGVSDVTAEETQRAKRQILKDRELAAADTSQIAVSLSEWAAQGDWRLYFLYRDRIEEVTPESVQDVARRYLVRNNRTLGLFIPTDEPEEVEIPPTPDVAALLKDYEGREVAAAGEAFDTSWANIAARTTVETLPGGLKTALLAKRTSGQVVRLRLTLRYGSVESLRGFDMATAVLPSLMTRGTKNLTRQELRDALDEHQATLSAGGGTATIRFSVQTKRDQLPAVLELLRQVVREPSLPEDEFEILRRQYQASYEQALSEPRYLASNRLDRTLSPYAVGDIRYTPTLEEQLEMVKNCQLEQIRTLYERYVGGQHGELVVVGDFDPEVVRPLLAGMLDGWEAAVPYTRIENLAFVDVPGSSQQIATPGKANAVYYAALAMPLRDDHPDYPALVIGDYLLGGGPLSSRLANRVRQQDGLSYSVGSSFSASSHDQRAELKVRAIANPDNIPKLTAAVGEEIDRLLADGASDEEVAQAVQAKLQSRQVSRASDHSLTSTLSSLLYADRTVDYHVALERSIGPLTADDVLAALRKHFDPNRLVIVTAGDFDKAEEE